MALPDVPRLSPEYVFGLFEDLGVEANPNNVEHFMTLMQALLIYNERSHSYNQVWKQYGALSNLLNAARKVDRLMEYWWTKQEEILDSNGRVRPLLHKDNLDDALDAVSYLVFFMRNAQAGNIFGGIPNRDTGNLICPHPYDAVMFNKFNRVKQCHQCGQVMEK